MNRMKKLQRAKRLVQDDEEQLTRKPAKKRKSDIFENVRMVFKARHTRWRHHRDT